MMDAPAASAVTAPGAGGSANAAAAGEMEDARAVHAAAPFGGALHSSSAAGGAGGATTAGRMTGFYFHENSEP